MLIQNALGGPDGLRLWLKAGQDNWLVSAVILLLKGSMVRILIGNNNIQVIYYDELFY